MTKALEILRHHKETMNHHHTGAELQTLRECARISREALATACDVEPRTIKHWETRKNAGVPADVWETMLDILRTVEEEAEDIFKAAKPGDVLTVYRENRHIPGCAIGLWKDIQRASVSAAYPRLVASGKAPRVVLFNPDSFSQWLSTQQHPAPTEAAQHAAWAAQQGLAEQAKPHRGDQPQI